MVISVLKISTDKGTLLDVLISERKTDLLWLKALGTIKLMGLLLK